MSLVEHLITEFSNTPFIQQIKQNPNFKRWFGDSKIVDENGNPLVVFHATYSDFTEFAKGDLGFHFGTDKSARERISKRIRRSLERGYRKTGAFFLSIESPLYSHDIESWDDPIDIIEQLPVALYEDGFINSADALYYKWKDLFYDNEYNDESWGMPFTVKEDIIDDIRNILYNDYGIDGIIYQNDFEDAGSDSYIAFFPEQIKSIFNSGEFDPNSKNFMK